MRLTMKITKCLSNLSFFLILSGITSGYAFAYGTDDNKKCRKPKFRDFEPVRLTEVAPGSEISFHVSGWADPDTIEATAKKIPMTVTVIDKMNFFIATAKLPDSLEDGFARLSIEAKAKDGRCIGKDGWLLKIKTAQSPQPVTEETPAATE